MVARTISSRLTWHDAFGLDGIDALTSATPNDMAPESRSVRCKEATEQAKPSASGLEAVVHAAALSGRTSVTALRAGAGVG
jgi:hypothetical protein